MKTFTKLLQLVILLSLAMVLKAQPIISGQNQICGGATEVYNISNCPGAGHLPIVTIIPSNAGSFSVVGMQITITWNSAWITSGCQGVAKIKVDIFNCGIDYYDVTISKKANTGPISGPGTFLFNAIMPIIGQTFPVVTYSVQPNTCTGNYIWETAPGWNIISGQGTTSINVQPTHDAPCVGYIRVTASGAGPVLAPGCGTDQEQITVYKGPTAKAALYNDRDPLKIRTGWLEICEGDPVRLDGSASKFCGVSDDINITVVECDVNWNNQPLNQWCIQSVSSSLYNNHGGLGGLNLNLFYSFFCSKQFTSINSMGSGNYKIRLAVGGGSTWNEYNCALVVRPRTIIAPNSLNIPNIRIDAINNVSTVECEWSGTLSNNYEIEYELSDDPGFPSNGTEKFYVHCQSPDYDDQTQTPIKVVKLIPIDRNTFQGFFFRFRVAQCQCGVWTTWSTNVLPPTVIPFRQSTGIKEVSNANQIRLYPNPASETIILENSSGTFEIQDVTGKIVLTGKTESGKPIYIKDLSTGLYIVKVKGGNGEASSLKFSKE